MSNDLNGPEKPPAPPDALAHLERMHERMKDQQEAWRKLLNELAQLTKKEPPDTDTGNNEPS